MDNTKTASRLKRILDAAAKFGMKYHVDASGSPETRWELSVYTHSDKEAASVRRLIRKDFFGEGDIMQTMLIFGGKTIIVILRKKWNNV